MGHLRPWNSLLKADQVVLSTNMTSGAQVRWYHKTEPWLLSLCNTLQRKTVLTWLLLLKLCRRKDVKKMVADASFRAYSKFVGYSLWHRRSTNWSFSHGQMEESSLLSVFSAGYDGAECQNKHMWMPAWHQQQHVCFQKWQRALKPLATSAVEPTYISLHLAANKKTKTN